MKLEEMVLEARSQVEILRVAERKAAAVLYFLDALCFIPGCRDHAIDLGRILNEPSRAMMTRRRLMLQRCPDGLHDCGNQWIRRLTLRCAPSLWRKRGACVF